MIVCSYNGALTLKDCLESLDKINYPDFEIVLVDDGSKDNTQQLVAAYVKSRTERAARTGEKLPDFNNIIQKNMGLSYARNVGAHAATGDVFAYTDGDCMPDPDWLYYLIGTLISGDYAGVGGPNISPPAELDPGRRGRRAGRGRAMCFSLTSLRSISRVATWRSIAGRLTVSAGSTANIARRGMTLIFAGGCKPAAA